MWIECRNKHKGIVHDIVDGLSVGLDAAYAVEVEAVAGVTEESDGVKNVSDDEWLEYIEFKVAVRATNGDGHVVAHNLSTTHRHSFALCRIDLTWHDG